MSAFESEKMLVYPSIVNYFGDITLKKMKHIPATSYDKPSYSIYYAKVGCLLCVEDRYIVAITENDNYPMESERFLSELEWVSFQTRTIETLPFPSHKIRTQQIQNRPNRFVSDSIQFIKSESDRNIYTSNLYPLFIELLYTDQDSNYSKTGSIQSALETYNCVLKFNFFNV